MTDRRFCIVLLSTMLLFSCTKEEQDIPLPPPGGGPDLPEFNGDIEGPLGMRMTFGGEAAVRVEGGSLVAYVENNGEPAVPPELSTRYYVVGLYDAAAEAPSFALTLGTLFYEGAQVLPDAFESFLAPGPRSYGPATMGQQGVELLFRDTDGLVWSTRCGSGAQAGAAFTITDILPGNDGLGQLITVAASFNCTLYQCGSGASVSVEDGLLVLEVREF